MEPVNCYLCGYPLIERVNAYKCSNEKCGLAVWKIMSEHKVTVQELKELMKNGRTSSLGKFVSKRGREFMAYLVLKDKKVEYEFPARIKDIIIRVEADNSGRCYLLVSWGDLQKHFTINFGLIPTVEVECYGIITAIRYIQYYMPNQKFILKVIVSKQNLLRYLTRDRIPRDINMRNHVASAHQYLDSISNRWQVECQAKRQLNISTGDKFPEGIFPWLQCTINKSGDNINVKLPDDPALNAQFKASLYSAVMVDGWFMMPLTSEKALDVWLQMVKKT